MAEASGPNGRSSPLPWMQFGWMVVVAAVSITATAFTNYFALREQIRADVAAQIQEARAAEAQARHQEMSNYLPLVTYWELREKINGSLANLQRTLDRIEYRRK
jgi:hypothetical protein